MVAIYRRDYYNFQLRNVLLSLYYYSSSASLTIHSVGSYRQTDHPRYTSVLTTTRAKELEYPILNINQRPLHTAPSPTNTYFPRLHHPSSLQNSKPCSLLPSSLSTNFPAISRSRNLITHIQTPNPKPWPSHAVQPATPPHATATSPRSFSQNPKPRKRQPRLPKQARPNLV